MPDPTARGRFVWHELMTTDTNSAVKFFTTLIGWKPQSWDQDPSYTLLTAKGAPMAGIMPLGDEAKAAGTPPSWMTYIYSPDVDDTCRQASSLGAKIAKSPSDIPTIGRFAVIQDPQGAAFSVITPQQAPGPQKPSVGDFSWHELATTDWKAAFTFYQRLFGWQETSAMDMGPDMGMYQMFGRDGVAIGGIYNKMKQQQGPPVWLPYIKVPDAKKAAVTIKKLGAMIANGPMEVPGGDWIVVGADPQGVMFAVHSAKPAVAKKAARSAKKRAKKPARKRTPARRAAAARGAGKKTAKRKVAKKKAAKKKAAKKKATPRRKTKAARRKAGSRRSR